MRTVLSAVFCIALLMIGGATARAQLDRDPGGAGGKESIGSEVYSCLAIDCRALAVRLGGGWIADPMQALASEGVARMAGGKFAVAGIAPYLGDVFGQSGEMDGGRGSPRPEGLTNAVALVEQNAILLQGTPEAIEQTLQLLELIDKPVPMVRIDLEAISSPDVFDRGGGLQWSAIGPQGVSTSGSVGGSGGSELRWATGDIGLSLNQFETLSRGYDDETLSIMTESGFPAYVGVRNTEPSFSPYQVRDRNGAIITLYDVYWVTSETSLYVVPRVNRDNSVTMFLSPQFSRKVGEVAPPGGTGFPIIENTELGTVVRVMDGQTIAIGGMRRVRADNTYQGARGLTAGLLPEVRRTLHVENVTLLVTPHVYRAEKDPIPDIMM